MLTIPRHANTDIAPDDEPFWLAVRDKMKPMYTHTQLVNTRRGSAPIEVRDRIRSLVDLALSYELDEYEPFRALKESGSSVEIRTRLASFFDADSDEIALMRNTMEGIATVLNGLALKPGDEILATNFCYDSNLAILRQRAKREGIVVKILDLPFGAGSNADIVKSFADAMGERTRLISIPHVVANTGLVLPVAEISALAAARGIFSFVDGAHSAGHIELSLKELGCDAFAACLHKWMYGPRGTGFLYVKRERIADIWPIFASWSNKPVDSIEKFEEVGTVFKALPAAIPDMLVFNEAIGQANKSARLRHLRQLWAAPLRSEPLVRMLTDLDATPGTSFGAFTIDGIENVDFARIMLEKHKIGVRAFVVDEDHRMKGIHLSPGLANTAEEIERFVAATKDILASR